MHRFAHLAVLFPALLFADTVVPEVSDYDRVMISGDVWANPMEDWQAQGGWMVNTQSGGNRNVASLTSEITSQRAAFTIAVEVKQISKELKSKGAVGVQLGMRGHEGDYRENAIYGIGLPVGVMADGRLFIGDADENAPRVTIPEEGIDINISATPQGNESHQVTLTIKGKGVNSFSENLTKTVHSSWLPGLVALTASSMPIAATNVDKPRPATDFGGIHFGRSKDAATLKPFSQQRQGDARYGFKNWKISGDAVKHFPERHYGPLWWATYTVDKNQTLRLLVQLGPIAPLDTSQQMPPVTLQLGDASHRAAIEKISHTASFQIPLKDVSTDISYTVNFGKDALKGIVRAMPKGDRPIVIASMSCNDSTGFPHNLLEENVRAQKPDFITFHGDQIYEEIGGYGFITTQQPSLRANVSYLRKYAMHGWTWRDIYLTTPSITIPDDHDVMHGNLWGCGGKLAAGANNFEAQDSGGYKMSSEFVNMVHQTQTGNLPKAKDQPTALNGISTFYTSFQYGPLDFVVLGDRQFKSSPKTLLADAQIKNGWPQNKEWSAKTQAAHPEAELLGPIQEEFLKKWASSPSNNSPFRIVISQAPFLAPQTLPKSSGSDADVPGLPVYPPGGYAPDDMPTPDFDTNSWPQNKQRLALSLMKQAGAIHIVGDQHLGTTGQYGVDGFDDGPWWIASPAIANVWPRRWMPSVAAQQTKPDWPRWKGGFEDGFGNKFTIHAVANPHDIPREPARLFDRAVGYAITRYSLKEKTITLENWPYTSGPQRAEPDAKPYPGWPITIQNAARGDH